MGEKGLVRIVVEKSHATYVTCSGYEALVLALIHFCTNEIFSEGQLGLAPLSLD